MSYEIILSTTALKKIETYKQDLRKSKKKPGKHLKGQLDKHKIRCKNLDKIDTKTFINLLLATKKPKVFGESLVITSKENWNEDEASILGDIGITFKTTFYNDGDWRKGPKKLATVKQHETPFEGYLGFANGILLSAIPNIVTADHKEISNDGGKYPTNINITKFNAILERHLLPHIFNANRIAEMQNKKAVVVIPGMGCGCFSGPFLMEGKTPLYKQHFSNAVKAMLWVDFRSLHMRTLG